MKTAFPVIKSVKAMPDYKLQLCYEDNREVIYDAKWTTEHLSDFFDQLIDPKYFAQVSTDGIGIEWPNGQSIGPYTLNEGGKSIVKEPADNSTVKIRCSA